MRRLIKKTRLAYNRRKWIKALKSGKYKKGKHALKAGEHYCCLGVAAEIFKGEAHSVGIKGGLTCYDGHDAVAPRYVVDALGLCDSVGSNKYGDNSLSDINDRRNDGFVLVIEAIKTGDYYV